jgi:2-oxoglutarate ferredoxin oxidoreductase subunit alpha
MARTAVNDLVIKFANVNGSGSASANLLFAKSVFRMGVPVSPKNIFPSNIQGLPTWFEVRVSDANHLGRREGIDLMVAMNAQTFAQDVAEIVPGGYLLYDNTLPRDFGRGDINVIGVPLTQLCIEAFDDPRQRQLFKNVAYVGALSALLDMDFEGVKALVAEQFRGKDKLIAPNIQALELGRNYVIDHLDHPISLTLQRSDVLGDRILIDGNAAAALGCVYAGATVAAWYPITPSTSLAEAFQAYCSRMRVDKETGQNKFAIVQAEDELAAIGMAIGANWNGARAFTATSGPGISLMSEFLGLAYFAEVPLVLFDIQRGGPSTGMPTRTQQSDVLACAYASHGDTKHILLFPSTPTECFDLTVEAFDLSDGLQTPIIMLSDLDLGMNDWTTDAFKWDDTRRMDRGKVLDAKALDEIEQFGRYRDVDGDGITYRTIPGVHPDKGAFFTRGTSRDENARYTEDGQVYARNMDRLTKKFATAAEMVPGPVMGQDSQASTIGVILYGTTDASMDEARGMLRAEGIEVDVMRLRAFPFSAEVRRFIESHETLIVAEQNRDAQMRTLLVTELEISPAKLVPLLNYDGSPVTARFLCEGIARAIGRDLSSAEADEVAAE